LGFNKNPYYHLLGKYQVALYSSCQRASWTHSMSSRAVICLVWRSSVLQITPIQVTHPRKSRLDEMGFIPASSSKTTTHTLPEWEMKRMSSSLVKFRWHAFAIDWSSPAILLAVRYFITYAWYLRWVQTASSCTISTTVSSSLDIFLGAWYFPWPIQRYIGINEGEFCDISHDHVWQNPYCSKEEYNGRHLSHSKENIKWSGNWRNNTHTPQKNVVPTCIEIDEATSHKHSLCMGWKIFLHSYKESMQFCPSLCLQASPIFCQNLW